MRGWKNEMKKIWWILILALIVIFTIFLLRGNEDSWIKDSRGVYIKHGSPSETPSYVLDQQRIINEALDMYNQEKTKGIVFNSQCLGKIGNVAVDIVHVPRTSEDDLAENQCEAYKNGTVNHFIELDKDGNTVRIV